MRFQFKLRTLLLAFSLACLALGFYWSPYIRVESLGTERFAVRCRFLHFGGPDSLPFELLVIASQGSGDIVLKQDTGGAWNTGHGRYCANHDFSLRAPSGEYHVLVQPVGSPELHTTLVVR